MALLPTTPTASSIRIASDTQNRIERSIDGTVKKIITGYHRWRISVGYTLLSKAEFAPIMAFLAARGGRYGTFTYAPPDLATPRGTALGSPLVKGASQLGTSLNIDGCTADQAAFLKAGDVFTIAGDTKVYMLTRDAAADGSGDATLFFRPALTASPSDNAALTVNDVEFTVRQVQDPTSYTVGYPQIYKVDLSLKEAF